MVQLCASEAHLNGASRAGEQTTVTSPTACIPSGHIPECFTGASMPSALAAEDMSHAGQTPPALHSHIRIVCWLCSFSLTSEPTYHHFQGYATHTPLSPTPPHSNAGSRGSLTSQGGHDLKTVPSLSSTVHKAASPTSFAATPGSTLRCRGPHPSPPGAAAHHCSGSALLPA